MRLLSLGVAALLAIAAAVPADAGEFGDVELFAAHAAVARLWLAPEVPGRPALRVVVVVVADVEAPDSRADRYTDRLNAAGIAALELILPDEGGRPEAGRDEIGSALESALTTLGADSRFDPERVGLLAFGAGARAVLPAMWDLEGGGGAPGAVALLYPGCAALSAGLHDLGRPGPARPAPVLLLHGDHDPANPPAACAALVGDLQRLTPAERIAYHGASYAWDRPRYGDLGPEMLPRPDGAGRVRVDPWPALADISAEHVARFFSLTLAVPR